MIKRNSKEVMTEVKRMLNILKAYDFDVKAFMYDEIVEGLKEKKMCVKEFILEGIKSLEKDIEENKGIDEDIVNFNTEYMEKLLGLDLEKLKEWQNNLVSIRNVEDNYIIERVTIRKIK